MSSIKAQCLSKLLYLEQDKMELSAEGGTAIFQLDKL